VDDIERAAVHVRARPFVWFIRIALSGLLLLILATLVGGILAVAWELRRLFADDVEVVLRHVLIGILILLAVVEVFKTALSYLTEGRVKVTFIVDTILVVMLTEIISLWLRGGDWKAFALLLAIVVVLGGVRVLAVRFSPSASHAADDAAGARTESGLKAS
jgi:uncharacterized membrane protein (DUF373 family)